VKFFEQVVELLSHLPGSGQATDFDERRTVRTGFAGATDT